MGTERTERFGTARWLQGAVLAGLLLWLLVAALLMVMTLTRNVELELGIVLPVLAFSTLFALAFLHYRRRAFIVDLDGITMTGAFTFRSFTWNEVIKVEKQAGYLPGYTIHTRRGPVAFFAHEIPDHQRLLEWIETFEGAHTHPETSEPPQDAPTRDPASKANRRHRRRRRRARR